MDYVKNLEEFEILPTVPRAIRALNQANFQVVIITNQSAINRGLLPISELNKIHLLLKTELSKFNAQIDGIYFCPHTPDEMCNCRKPNPGLILKAAKELNIDLTRSLMIGDHHTDIQAAKNAGMKSFLMKTNDRLIDIVNLLLKKYV